LVAAAGLDGDGLQGRAKVHARASQEEGSRAPAHATVERNSRAVGRGRSRIHSPARTLRRAGRRLARARATTVMTNGNEQRSEELERRYKVRQVTDIQASWVETERGEEGRFTLQLILDNGVEEYILEPDADDIGPMLKLFKISGHTTFDLERKVLMFSNLKIR
jgi:hypothetical protein